jgi:hypothetical protein
MSNILGQVSYPVFISGVFVFFILASVFSFIVGVGLATRSAAMLRFFSFMNKSFSSRRMMKPLTVPHYVEPVLLKHPVMLGAGITLGAIVAVVLLREVDSVVFQPMYAGSFSAEATEILANYTHKFLLIGNTLCIVVGVLLMFFPQTLTAVERYTDKWYTFRKQTRPLHDIQFDVDHWVLQHPTVSGVTLSLLSLGLGMAMYARL